MDKLLLANNSKSVWNIKEIRMLKGYFQFYIMAVRCLKANFNTNTSWLVSIDLVTCNPLNLELRSMTCCSQIA